MRKAKVLAVTLGAVIVLNSIPDLPFWAAGAEKDGEGTAGVIYEVEELPDQVLMQTVDYGTAKSRLNLPKRLKVAVRSLDDGDNWTATVSNASRSNAQKEGEEPEQGQKITIPVQWKLEESFSEQDEYDGKVPGSYLFQAELKNRRYDLETSLPVIEVQVMEADHPLTIVDWQWGPSEQQDGVLALPGVSEKQQADFETVAAMLPQEIQAKVQDGDGNQDTKTIPIAEWNCPDYEQDQDGSWPVSGTYTFRAVLPEEYALSGTAEKLEVEVVLGGAQLYSNESIQLGSFIVSSSEGLEEGVDYSFEYQNGLGVLEIQNSKEIKIEPIYMDMEITDTVISAAPGIEANITLKDIIIDVSGISGACAVDLSQVSSATVTLEGSNTVKSGSGRAGLEMGTSGIFTIDGAGSLSGYGGDGAAGIGSGPYGSIETLTIECFAISGYGGENAAGIGGGEYGQVNFFDIRVKIIGAEGGTNGAGLGCGYGGSIGSISMSGGQGTLTGGNGGAGIGTGASGNTGSSQIRLENTYLVVEGGEDAAGIGGGRLSSGGQIIIKGGTVEVTGDPESEIIGNGVGGGASSLMIDEASVKADCASRVQSMTGNYNYRCPLKDQDGVTGVRVDGTAYNIKHNHRTDNALYLYLSEGRHEIQVERGDTVSEFTVYVTGAGLLQRILWPTQAEELTYGQSLKESGTVDGQATDGSYNELPGQFAWKEGDHIPQAGDGQEFTIQFVPEDSDLPTEEHSLMVDVNPAQLTVTADDQRITEGDGKPNYTATVQGLADGEKLEQIEFSDNAGDYSVPGEYEITPRGGTILGGRIENYEISYIPGTLTIQEKEVPDEPEENPDQPGGEEVPDQPGGEETPSEPGSGEETPGPQEPSEETPDQPEKPLGSGGSSDGGEINTVTIDPQKGRVDRYRGILTGEVNGSGGGYSHWHDTEDGWRLQYADGSYASGSGSSDGFGNWIEIYRWELINRVWYAFDSRGYAADGLFFDGGYNGWFYVDVNSGLKTGWQYLNGKWYYFNPRSDGTLGIMFTGRQTLDGWYVKENGEWDGQPKKR